MNKLYDQLLYNWERGFYSVVQDKWDDYYVVSTKSWNHGFFITEPQLTVIAAKARIGDSKEYSGDLINTLVNPVNGGWKIIENETFHPSELMGKGFQVGDKVKVPRIDGSCEVIKASSGNKDAYEVKLPINYSDMPSQFFTSSELKPVLPVEEKKEDPLKGIMTLQQYHELADLADNFMSKFKSVKDGSLSSKEREACKIVNL